MKIYKIPLRLYGHVERMQNQRKSKQIATAAVERIIKRGWWWKIWRGEVEEHLNIMGIRNRQALVKVHNKLFVLEKNMLIPNWLQAIT